METSAGAGTDFAQQIGMNPVRDGEIPSKRAGAVRLFWETILSLGWHCPLFIAATLVFALVSLLPATLFHYFAPNVATLSELSAERFITLLVLFGILVALALFVSSVLAAICQEWLQVRIEVELRRKVLRAFHSVPLTVLDSARTEGWAADLKQSESFLSESVPRQLREVAIVIGSGFLFFACSGGQAWLPLLACVLLAIFSVRIQKKLFAELYSLHDSGFQLLRESLQGIRTIRSHSVEAYVERRLEARLKEGTSTRLRVVRRLGVLPGSNDLLSLVFLAGCLGVVFVSLSSAQVSLDAALLYPFFIGMFHGSAQGLVASVFEWNRYFVEGGRVAELLYQSAGSLGYAPLQAMDFSKVRTLELRGVVVEHAANKRVGPLSLKVLRGEMLALVGFSACGKSTFLEALAGLRPAISGKGYLTDSNGERFWESDRKGLKFPIGLSAFVEQRPYIFEGSLRDNLTFGNPNRISDTLLWQSLEQANLYHFARVCGGLDAFLRDRGKTLSAGERYRIALCRALLLKRPFLLLDEPFTTLDPKSVEWVTASLEREKHFSGIVLVTPFLPKGLLVDEVMDFNELIPKSSFRHSSEVLFQPQA